MSAIAPYDAFLASKAPRVEAAGLEPGPISPILYAWQAAIVRWSVRLGRAAIFADCGLGKTLMQLEWARQFVIRANARVLIAAPLGVTEQTIAEARLLGLEVRRARTADEVLPGPGIWITNYERLDRFAALSWDAIVLDESSILKSFDGETRRALLATWSRVRWRLCCTATPAPNELIELANHAEFLGVLTYRDMVSTFFTHDTDLQEGKSSSGAAWRVKGHAEGAFFRWLACWTVFVRRPSDLGFPDDGYILPPLEVRDDVVLVLDEAPDGDLFAAHLPGGVEGRALARRASLAARVARGAEIIRETAGQWIVWCGLNAESEAITKALGEDAVEVAGNDDETEKIEREARWRGGAVRVLVSKPRIFGFGLNWQHCHNVLFLGIGDSYEQYYQAIRRCWRFGQREPVRVRIVVSHAEGVIAENVRRKELEAAQMAERCVAAMRDEQVQGCGGKTGAERDDYVIEDDVDPAGRWHVSLGDCVERIRDVPSESVGLSIFSPPFAALFVYSNSPRDMGNARGDAEFFAHFAFLIRELRRVTMPGRRACVHVAQLTCTLNTHGREGVRDFRGDVIRAFEREGWWFDNDIAIDKNPQIQAVRTKAKHLLFVQKNKDSAESRPGLADYLLLFKKPGKNLVPVRTDVSDEEWITFAHPVWYDIRQTEVLNPAIAREKEDERHCCPLQLEPIRRAVRLWSNPGEVVCSPFAGIGSEGHEAVKLGRRFRGFELKRSYYEQAKRNLRSAVAQGELFAAPPAPEEAA